MEKLAPPKTSNSAVWSYFGMNCVNGAVDDCSLDVCCICKIELKCHRGTSSLINHLSSKHPLEYCKTSFKRRTTGCCRFADDHDMSLLCTDMCF